MANPSRMGASASHAAAHAQPSSPHSVRAPAAFALAAEDNAGELRSTLDAYAAVEKLIGRVGKDDHQAIVASRDEMGALMRVLNEHMASGLDALESSLAGLRSAHGTRECMQ